MTKGVGQPMRMKEGTPQTVVSTIRSCPSKLFHLFVRSFLEVLTKHGSSPFISMPYVWSDDNVGGVER